MLYPVEDENKFTDRKGVILPDAFLMKRGSTARDLAFRVHSDIGESFLFAIDGKTQDEAGREARAEGRGCHKDRVDEVTASLLSYLPPFLFAKSSNIIFLFITHLRQIQTKNASDNAHGF